MKVSRSIERVTAPNGGPFTGNGTNSYVVRRGQSCVVIDPGPDDETHLAAILGAAAGCPIAHILVTHAHRDHVDGVARLKALTGATTVGFGRLARPKPGADPSQSPSSGDFVDWAFMPDRVVTDGEVITLPGFELVAVHTPGHAPDHLCFALTSTPYLFSGDHVMGWSTSVIAPPEGHMGDYLASLEKLIARSEAEYLPGHGDAIPDGPRQARAYLIHRQMREQAVLGVIRQGTATVQSVTDSVYAELAANLANAARLSVIAHVELLAEKGLVAADRPLQANTQLRAT